MSNIISITNSNVYHSIEANLPCFYPEFVVCCSLRNHGYPQTHNLELMTESLLIWNHFMIIIFLTKESLPQKCVQVIIRLHIDTFILGESAVITIEINLTF